MPELRSTPAARLRWSDRIGVRWRSTAAAVLVVAMALVIGGLALLFVLRYSLESSINAAVTQRARDIAAQVSTDDVAAAGPTINASTSEGTLVQIVGKDGSVLSSSPSLEGELPITAARPSPGQMAGESVNVAPISGERFRVISIGARSTNGPVVVVAAQSLSSVRSTLLVVAALLGLGAPFLLLAVGVATWMAVGRSLAAVDRLRRRVDTIGATDLHYRVPVPPSEDEVARLAETMNSMLARLEESAISQRQFVADASHELRSPLSSLRASLDVASRSGGIDAWAVASPVMSDEVDRMTSLVSGLLLLARADEGALAMRLTDVDLDDLIAGEARRLRAQTSLMVSTDAVPVRIVGDPDRLSELLRNLTDNAARFAHAKVHVALRAAGGVALLVVEDDGPGIAPADRARVLERFVRLDEHRGRTHGGAGLGLAIASEIARAHGGGITIEASTLGGACMTVSLPLTGPAQAQSIKR